MNTEATTTTYVAYQHPGVFFSEESVVKVTTRNPERDAVKASDNAFAFSYFDIVTTTLDIDGERIETSSGRRNISKTYYIDAELLTSEQVAALPGDNHILLSNMRGNGWDYIASRAAGRATSSRSRQTCTSWSPPADRKSEYGK